MILSDSEIVLNLNKGNIVIKPFNAKYLNPNTVDLTLNKLCKRYIGDILDCKAENPVEEFDIPEEGYVLQPGELYLYSCNERIGVKNNICATVMGKSSLGRLGLDIHVCAGFVDTGFEGSLVLEMRVIKPLKIYPNMKICQIKFEYVEGEIMESYDKKSTSKYHNQSGVVESKMHKNF
jgi:dCTP deaminase